MAFSNGSLFGSIATQPPETPKPKTSTSTKPDPPQTPTYIDIDPDGDLHLKVGDNEAARLFVVCSKSLARSSPFWKKLLYGGFAESKKPDPQVKQPKWVVNLPDDDPKSMRIFLDIIHGHFKSVPGYEDPIPLVVLHKLSVLSDKYDMTHLLKPWARGWSKTIHSLRTPGPSSRSLIEQKQQLWVSWVFGDQPNFEHLARDILLNRCSLSTSVLPEPPGIYENIEHTRLYIIGKLFDPFHDILQKLIKQDHALLPKTFGSDRTIYTSLMLGTAIQSLYVQRLWPIPHPQAVYYDIQTLADRLKKVRLESSENGFYTLKVRNSVDETLKSIPSLVTELHRRHLGVQANKSGLI